MSTSPPRILAIAGSDSSGGAGIQADIKTVTMLGGYAMTAITAITAQNTLGVSAVVALPADMVEAQIEACVSDIGVDAVKIGMLGSPDVAHRVADLLEDLAVPVVFDPVMVATSGAVLADAATIAAFERLMRLATVVTPNIPELEALSGLSASTELAMAEAAKAVMKRSGAAAVLAKGGHWPDGVIIGPGRSRVSTDKLVFDCLFALSKEGHWQEWCFHHGKVDTRHTHGTGCTLSSAIATLLAQGQSLDAAIAGAREFVRAALLAAPGFGSGHGPMGHQAVRWS